MADDRDNPMTLSSDYKAMADDWHMVSAILCGATAMREVAGGSVWGPQVPYATLKQLRRVSGNTKQSPFLPQFPNETVADYEIRRCNAPLTNIYADISANLASKPFSKKLELDEDSPSDLLKLQENIDGQGNNLHVFARETFKASIDKGIDWILVDYTKVPPGVTLADERNMGARPYWVHIPAERMLAVYSVFFAGKEVITHARVYEPATKRNGYEEACVNRVREFSRLELYNALGQISGFGPATWELKEEQVSKDASNKETKTWVTIDGGVITVGEITLVPVVVGKRAGTSWRVEMPLAGLAHMQIEEFQQESNLKSIKELTAFPMLAGNGVTPPVDTEGAVVVVPVGPRAVLFAPPGGDGSHGEWTFIEPTAASLTFLKDDLEAIRTEMRNLGMQPLATANLTVVTTANVSMKAHSAVQAWALGLKDALEQAWKLTCKWLGQNIEPEVNVFTDFGVDLEAGTELDSILKAEGQGIISKEDVAEEFKRRGVLRDSFDWKENEQRLAEEQSNQTLQPEKMIDPVTGQPIVVTPEHGIPNPPPVVN